MPVLCGFILPSQIIQNFCEGLIDALIIFIGIRFHITVLSLHIYICVSGKKRVSMMNKRTNVV